MSTAAAVRHNPYVGPEAFQRGQPLFGRDTEVRQLLDLLIAERIVLLHAPSGAGKTSLIQAALLPRLEQEGFRALPIVRVSRSAPELTLEKHHNRFVLSALLCLESAFPEERRTPARQLAGMTLPAWFERYDREHPREDSRVLVIDQFEELLTLDAPQREPKAEFFRQVGEVLRKHDRWALFAIREDYLGALEPYTRAVPTRLKTTFRLDLLGEEAARQAIQEPPRREGAEFTDEAARKLVDDLRRVRVQQPDGTVEEQLGPYVEPVQLQVVCFGLWERLPPDDRSIDPEDVETVGNADEVLARYYAERVSATAAGAGASEWALRNWFEHQLLLKEGIRGQVLREAEESGGLKNAVVEQLVRTHLVRAESRGNRVWYELAHDRLIKPIRKGNAAWFAEHLSLLQRQAQSWHEQGRMAALLLRDEALAAAERQAVEHPEDLGKLEREFLERCREARILARKARRKNVWIAGLAVAASLFSVLLLVAYQFIRDEREALQERNRQLDEAVRKIDDSLQRNEQISKQLASHLFAARPLKVLNQRPDLALLWPMTRLEVDDTPELRSSLLTALLHQPDLVSYRRHGSGPVVSLAMSPDGRFLASGGQDKRIVLWDLKFGIQLETLEHESDILDCIFSSDGRLLASATREHGIILWEFGEDGFVRRKAELKGHLGPVLSVAFQGAEVLASGGVDGTVRLWEVKTGRMRGEPLNHEAEVRAVAFSHDGRRLAAAGKGGYVHLWELTRSPYRQKALPTGEAEILSLRFSPTEQLLAMATHTGAILLWNPATRAAKELPTRHQRSVYEVAFRGDGLKLVSVGLDKKLIVWDVATGLPDKEIETLRLGSPLCVAFHPAGKHLAWGDEAGTLTLWALETGLPRLVEKSVSLRLPEGAAPGLLQLALSQDGAVLASHGGDGLQLRDPVTLEPVGEPLSKEEPTFLSKLALSRDGRLLAMTKGKEIQLWNTAERRLLGTLQTGYPQIQSLTFSSSGATLAATGQRGPITLWSTEGLTQLGPPLEHPSGAPFGALAFSPVNEQLLASGDATGALLLWSVASGQPPRKLPAGHERIVYSLAFSPDGKRLASGGWDSRIGLWDVETGKLVAGLHEHSSAVVALAFSQDGRMLASAGVDKRLVLWHRLQENDTRRWEMLGLPLPLAPEESVAYGIGFAAQGRKLLSMDGLGLLTSRSVGVDDWKLLACLIAGRSLTVDEWSLVEERAPAPGVLERACVLSAIEQAHLAALSSRQEEARAAYLRAVSQLEPIKHPLSHNIVCWYGATDGFAKEVLPSCQSSVQHAPEYLKAMYRDSRGVAYAVAGRYSEAIEDFQAFVNWAKPSELLTPYSDKRKKWLEELRQGRNPFDAATLKALQRE
jgi:WD40 repeat protein